MEVVASLSQGRRAAAQCGLFTYKSVPVIFEPPCISLVEYEYVLYFYISTSRSVCAVPNTVDFCNSLVSCCPGMLLRYFLSDFGMVPIAPVITGITFAFTFHMK